MFGYGNFKAAARPETPNYANATAQKGTMDANNKARVNALRSSNILGAGGLYNAGMGAKTPIADALFGETVAPKVAAEGAGMSVDVGGTGGMSTAAPSSVAPAAMTPEASILTGGTAPAPVAATSAAGAGSTAATGLGTVAGTALPPAAVVAALYGLDQKYGGGKLTDIQGGIYDALTLGMFS